MQTRGQGEKGAAPGEELGERLRAHRLKLTPQRTAVFRAVRELGHASPRRIYETLRQAYPMLSLNTVYATLETLERVGQILRITGPEGSMMYEAASPIHHHFHCLRCRRVLDVHDPSPSSIALPPPSWARFTVTSCRLEVYGFCPECRRRRGSGVPVPGTPRAGARRRTAAGNRAAPPRDRTRRAGTRRTLGASVSD